MRPRATAVMPLDNYQLAVLFSNGEHKIFDVKPYLDFAAFKNVSENFASVHIAGLSIAWDEGADICPDELCYNSVSVE